MELRFYPEVQYAPAYSQETSLLTLRAQANSVFPPQSVTWIELGYAVQVPVGYVCPVFLCGHLRRSGLRLHDDSVVLVHLSDKRINSPLRFQVVNNTDRAYRLHAGDDLAHAYALRVEKIAVSS